MPQFFIILLKINLVLILFAAAYYFILRRLTFYVINRIFLAFGILFSTIYPFIDLTDFFHKQNQRVVAFVPQINQQVKSLVPDGFIGEYWQWLAVLFYVGVIVMTFRLLVQFISLYRMHKTSTPGSIANYRVRILDAQVSPFSFWQTVYINPSLHQEKELKTILAHEQIHVKQWHSLDIILAELSVIFYWFNPGVWLIKRAVKENLEFITDEKILKKGVDKKAYQYSLLDVSNLVPAVQIVNNFNLSDLKKRIKMMNAKRSSKLTLSRYMLVLPILLITTLAFTVSKKDINIHLAPIKEVLTITKLIDSVKPESLIIEKKQKARKKIKIAAIDTVISLQLIKQNKIDSMQSNLPEITLNTRNNLNQKIKITGVFIGEVDSLRRNKNTVKIVSKPIVVKGYKSISNPQHSLDTAKVDVYLDGKKITKEGLNKLNLDEIKSVDIKKQAGISEIRITGAIKKVEP